MYVHVCIQMYICRHVTIITKELYFGGGNIGGTQGGSDAYVVFMYEDKEAGVQREAYRDILKNTTSKIYHQLALDGTTLCQVILILPLK